MTAWIRIGGMLMALAIALGAFGAHGLRDRLDGYSMGVYEKAVFYHAIHALGVLIVSLLPSLALLSPENASRVAMVLTGGILFFSGSLYLLAVTGGEMVGRGHSGGRSLFYRRMAASGAEVELMGQPLSDSLPGEETQPFLKWVGGKRQLLDALRARLPDRYRRYHEPFLGGGALFFAIRPKESILSDLNAHLIETYCMVRDRTEELIRSLETHRYERDYFYRIRNLDREPSFLDQSPVERASRFIFLNRTCFNGLYRVNRGGFFNVPFGRYQNPRIVNGPVLRGCAEALRGAMIRVGPFQAVAARAERGDFVYFDPPYAPLTATANFTGYQGEGFTAADQVRLRDLCRELDRRGVFWMQSNSTAPLISALYQGFRLETVSATRAINSDGNKRGPVREFIIRNY